MHLSFSTLSLAVLGSVALSGSLAIAQNTSRVSLDSTGQQANSGSTLPAISADGRYVAFVSDATNLVPGDTNGCADVFVHDCQSGTTERVSVDSAGVQGNGVSGFASSPSISSDGRFVAFRSAATNLVPGDTNGFDDVFVHDRQTGSTERVSVSTGGTQGNYGSGYQVSISGDGRYVAFSSDAYNLIPPPTVNEGVFVRDRQNGTTECASVDSNGVPHFISDLPSISADGRYVVFSSYLYGPVGYEEEVYLHDRLSGLSEMVSVDSAGTDGTFSSYYPFVTADGRFVAFDSYAGNLVPGDTNGCADVFVRDRQSGTTERESVDSTGVQANGGSGNYANVSISSDGRYIAFNSYATNLVPGDTNGHLDVFVRDQQAGTTMRVSVDSSGAEVNGDSGYTGVAASADGRFVVYASDAANLVPGDTNAATDIFVYDRECSGNVATYCTGKLNSLGCMPSISSIGLPSQSGADNFFVTASNVRNQKFGMMLWGLTQDSHPFFGGTLCLHNPIKRTPGQNSGGSPSGNDCTGTYSYHFTQTYMLQQLLSANTTVYAQFWSRDPGFAPPNNIGLTNGLQFTICP